MAVRIDEDPNDRLLVSLLGIGSIDVQFATVEFDLGTLVPTSAEVTLRESAYPTAEPTEDQQYAVRQWAARKIGINVQNVTIA